MRLGLVPMSSALAALCFHALLLVHYALIRALPHRAALSTVFAVGALNAFAVLVSADIPFMNNYLRVVAVLFSMQIIRLQQDPAWISAVQRLSLRSYLLRVISFGSAEQSVAAESNAPLSWRAVIEEALFMLAKYLVINAIHVYYHFYPYRRDPTLRALLPLDLHSFLEYYLLAIQLFLYMSFYYAFSFGLFALLCGRLSPPVFNAPLLARSPRDFWSRRWNMLFKQCLHDLIFVPVLRLAELLHPTAPASSASASGAAAKKRRSPAPRSPSPRRASAKAEPAAQHAPSLGNHLIARHPLAALVAGQMTFLFSGIMHEYFLYVIFHITPTWENLLFFNLHGVFCVAQILIERTLPAHVRRLVPTWLGCAFTTVLFVYISPLFFNVFLRVDALNEFHLPLLLPLYDKWCLRWVNWPPGAVSA